MNRFYKELNRRCPLKDGRLHSRTATLSSARTDKSWLHGAINARASIKARWQKFAVDGQIAVHRRGRDCDGVSYYRVRNIQVPTSVFAWDREEMEHQSWLDGPESHWFSRPQEEVSESRDLVMEAHENGHPHVIYDTI